MSGEDNKIKPETPNAPNDSINENNQQRSSTGGGGGGVGGGGVGGGGGTGGGGGPGMGNMGNPRGGGRGRKGGSRFSGGGRGGGMVGRMDGQMKMEGMDGGMDNMDGGGGPGMMGGMGRGGMRGGRGGGRGGGGAQGSLMGPRSQDERLMNRIMQLSGPTHDLPTQDTTEKKFSGRNRLYVGNLTNDVTEKEIQDMFQSYGGYSELFIHREKNFAFLRMDYRANAEKAKCELDGFMRKGRALKVRFAPNSSIVKVKNLAPFVSNELLEKAFSVFGEIERAVVIVDERGKSLGEGIIEFAKKPAAVLALRMCTEGCYFLTASLRPVVVETYVPPDEIDGYSDKSVQKKSPEFFKAREVGPRFAHVGSFEHEYGTRWKQLYELYKQKEEALKREMAMEEQKLEAQMEFARYEHETELLRDQLRQREADRERQKREWEMKERKAEEQRTRDEEVRRRQQEEMTIRIRRQEEELHRRQQENNLFMQEQAMRGGAGGPGGGGGGGGGVGGGGGGGGGGKNYDSVGNDRDGYGGADGGNNLPVDPKSFMDAYNNLDRGNRGGYNDERGQLMDLMDMRVDMGNMGGGGGGGRGGNAGGSGGGRWQGGGNDRNRPDDYPNKRRRY